MKYQRIVLGIMVVIFCSAVAYSEPPLTDPHYAIKHGPASREVINYDDLILDSNGKYYVRDTRENYTGRVIGSCHGEIIDGSEIGAWTCFYDNGRVRRKEFLVVRENGDFFNDGPYFSYYPSGQIHTEENWNNGVREGRWVEYNENGDISDEGNCKIEISPNLPQIRRCKEDGSPR
jgi:hypothetical protein